MIHPVHTSRRQPDGCYEVYYFDKLVGWLRQSSIATGAHSKPKTIWRALSVNGDLRHERSQASARAALLEMVH
jgi:hypothetical protein